MKNILLLIGLLSTTLTFAQEEDTTKFKVGGLEFIIINHGQDTILVDSPDQSDNGDVKIKKNTKGSDEELAYWSGFEFGPSILLNSSGGTGIESNFLNLDASQSFSYNFNLFEKFVPFGTSHVGLVTGLGLTHSRFGFKNNYTIQDSMGTTIGVLDSLTQYNKNQLRATYLTVPLLLNINTSKRSNNNFHIAAGVIGGVRLSSKTVQKFDVLGKESKRKSKGVYNLNPFQAIATARVGYKDVGLFANYNLLSLFESGAAEEVFPLTLGVSLHF